MLLNISGFRDKNLHPIRLAQLWDAGVVAIASQKAAVLLRMDSQLNSGQLNRILPLEDEAEAQITIWKEALFTVDLFLLHASPVYYGLGIPHGDHSGVVIIPGFLGSDHYLAELRYWVGRIGYEPYFSGIGINAECPNLLIQQHLNGTIEKALRETGRKVHLIGHSLGGVIARSVAGQRPDDIASVITLAAPFRGTIAHRSILRAAESVRRQILKEHGPNVLPRCYTARCTCNFLNSLRRRVPVSVMETAIYTLNDGIVDSRYCRTGNCKNDFEVPGTHIGLAFNSSAYKIIAERLAEAQPRTGPVSVPGHGRRCKCGPGGK